MRVLDPSGGGAGRSQHPAPSPPIWTAKWLESPKTETVGCTPPAQPAPVHLSPHQNDPFAGRGGPTPSNIECVCQMQPFRPHICTAGCGWGSTCLSTKKEVEEAFGRHNIPEESVFKI
eukprot:CAMPEP_0174332442 /NCGR_PEP_ID=MMETSP0810-20121108/18300_1 /TAXON_ID=73025 ORGANISM="Eutreptiella gymnastica-like, Strain CCMP1594" /NCGR_SAMPLE_ID=MMETSP0810 /ASSEMBLY_ACC=CAM_ASM_000659 /LENGTH=117 /DNA_ID=CAMNT_0015448851 /DNA_START=330 /DNA_END=683 /DNA_ORIENTATION=-